MTDNQAQLLGEKQYKYKESDPNYQGEDLDENLLNGPIENRKCTDIIFFILFWIFFAGMIIVSIMGFKKGQPNLIASPFDYNGNHCGITDGFTDYKRIYFPDVTEIDKFICVKECPKSDDATLQYNPKDTDLIQGLADPVYKTHRLANICIPTSQLIWDKIKDVTSIAHLEEQFHDLAISWPILLACFGVGFVLGYIFLYLLKFCAGIMLWGFILMYLVVLGVLGYICYHKSNSSQYDNDDGTTSSTDGSSSSITDSKSVLRVLAYSFWSVAGISLIVIICLYKRIKIAIACLKASARFVNDTFSIILVPISIGILVALFLTYWIYSALFLYSSGDVKQRGETPFATVKWSDSTRHGVYYFIVALILMIEFFIGIALYIIGNACCLWYFAQPQQPNAPILRSVYNVLRYHLGSIALGALILTIIWIIKILLEYFHKMCKNVSDGHANCFVNFWFKCAHCCVGCFERFIRFLNMKAYIMIALTGQNFCKAAYDGFYLAIRNLLRFGALTTIGALFIWLGELLIASLTALFGFLMITKINHFDEDMYSPVIPTLFFFLIGYFIGSFIMGIFGISSDAILTCFCIDEELNQKKGHTAAHCPQELKELLNKQ